MQEDKSIMRYESVLPADFDGIFRFSNPFKEDFEGVWNSKKYIFPAETTSPMIMTDHSPLEIQHIRKKFAKDLAEREFYKSKGYKVMAGQEGKPGNRTMTGIHQAATYTFKDLEPYIEMCLKPLKSAKASVQEVPRQPMEEKLTRGDDGQLNTEVVDRSISLHEKAFNAPRK